MPESLQRPRIVTIDGEPGAGKTTLCTLIAERLGYQTLTTGMLYCAVASLIPPSSQLTEDYLSDLSIPNMLDLDLSRPGKPEISFQGKDLTDTIFSQSNKNQATRLSSNPALVFAISSYIRTLASSGEWVMDRGSEVFPDADLKVWLRASPTVRATRRCGQLALDGKFRSYDQVLAEMLERETRDKANPYINNHDPNEVQIDNTHMSEEQTFRVLSTLLTTSPTV